MFCPPINCQSIYCYDMLWQNGYGRRAVYVGNCGAYGHQPELYPKQAFQADTNNKDEMDCPKHPKTKNYVTLANLVRWYCAPVCKCILKEAKARVNDKKQAKEETNQKHVAKQKKKGRKVEQEKIRYEP